MCEEIVFIKFVSIYNEYILKRERKEIRVFKNWWLIYYEIFSSILKSLENSEFNYKFYRCVNFFIKNLAKSKK